MTRRHHQSSSECTSYSSATGPTHHRRTTPTQKQKVVSKEDYYNVDDDADASEYSQEDEYESDEEEEEPEQDIDEDDNNVNGISSEYVSNNSTPPNVPETSTSISASDLRNPSSNSSSSYVKIAPLPIFRGMSSESPVTHLSRFNKVCRANNASSVDMQMRIFPVTLEDEAALWYDLNVEPYYGSLSWEETKLSFLQAYYDVEPVEELRSKLVGIRQDQRESVRSYFLRLQWILKRWPEHGLGEDVLKGVFVDGLREEFREWVLMQKPGSLNDALKLAFEFEKVWRVRGKEGVGPTCEVRDVLGKDLIVGSCSVGEISSGQERVEDAKGSEGLVRSVKKKQCHKCGKKKDLRNSSIE